MLVKHFSWSVPFPSTPLYLQGLPSISSSLHDRPDLELLIHSAYTHPSAKIIGVYHLITNYLI